MTSATPVRQLMLKPISESHYQAGDDDGELQIGDLCVLRLEDDIEPILVARYLGRNPNQPYELVVQWLGDYTSIEEPKLRLRRQRWKNGWFQPRTKQGYYSNARQHPTHFPFSNMLTAHHGIQRKDILLHGFGLRIDGRLPQAVANQALKIWEHVGPRATQSSYLDNVAETAK